MPIVNKTQKPLSVPLPGGKRLHLGPGKTGEVSRKALEHPPLQELVASGALEVIEGRQRRRQGGAGGGPSRSSNPGHRGEGGVRHTGDR